MISLPFYWNSVAQMCVALKSLLYDDKLILTLIYKIPGSCWILLQLAVYNNMLYNWISWNWNFAWSNRRIACTNILRWHAIARDKHTRTYMLIHPNYKHLCCHFVFIIFMFIIMIPLINIMQMNLFIYIYSHVWLRIVYECLM